MWGSAGRDRQWGREYQVAGAHTIVENMRRGLSPHEAGMDALKRHRPQLQNDVNKLKFVDMMTYSSCAKTVLMPVSRCGKLFACFAPQDCGSRWDSAVREDGGAAERAFLRNSAVPGAPPGVIQDSEYYK